MENYNYYQAVTDDAIDAAREWLAWYGDELRDEDGGIDLDDLRERLYDDFFVDDSVTGNASGSYWFNSYKAAEALFSNLDLLADAVEEFGGDMDVLKDGTEACDVTIRCYVLGQVMDDVIDAIRDGITVKE